MNKFILDNGAYLAKCGFSVDSEPKLVPNFIAKSKNARETYVGGELNDCKDFSGLFYNLAFHKGILVNWDLERQVWNQIFKKQSVDFSSTSLIVTEPIFNFNHTQECIEEICFEEYGFEGLIRINGPTLAAYNYLTVTSRDFCLVVDSGYSFTHIVPFFKGNVILEGVRRINVGGKHLTNYLKEVISYRQLMVMDETYVINQVKEDVCYVSTDFENDMKIAKKRMPENTIITDYVLPDYANIRKGYAKPQHESTGIPSNSEQIIRLNNERFTIPELLFHPSDIGINEMGIPEAIVDSIDSCPHELRPNLYSNILLVGGNTLFPGFRDRVYQDVRSKIPDELSLSVTWNREDATRGIWSGGRGLANSPEFNNLLVNKKAYDEYGHSYCKKKFDVYQSN